MGDSRLAEIGLVAVPPIATDVDPLVVGHAGIQSLGVFALEVHRNLTVEALAAHHAEPYVRVLAIGRDGVAATRPANKNKVFVGFIWIAFHRRIFSSNRPLARVAISGSVEATGEHGHELLATLH